MVDSVVMLLGLDAASLTYLQLAVLASVMVRVVVGAVYKPIKSPALSKRMQGNKPSGFKDYS
jgi:hypothetical protein